MESGDAKDTGKGFSFDVLGMGEEKCRRKDDDNRWIRSCLFLMEEAAIQGGPTYR